MTNQKKNSVFKYELFEETYFTELNEMPILEPTYFRPDKAIPFDKISTTRDYDQWVHFFIHD